MVGWFPGIAYYCCSCDTHTLLHVLVWYTAVLMLTVAYVLLYRTPVRMTRNSTAIIAPTHLLPFVCTYAYFSSYRYELGQPRCCQNGRLAMPRSILRNWMWFFDTVLIMHQPTNGNQALFLCFLFERYDRYNDPEKYKSDRNLSEKKEKKRGLAFRLSAYAVQIRG